MKEYIEKLSKISNNKKKLSYYAFDFDDNILFMDTKINLVTDSGEIAQVSTSFYADNIHKIGVKPIRYKGQTISDVPRLSDGTIDNHLMFGQFGDTISKGIFLAHIKDSIKKDAFAPSWLDFKECVISGSIFAIITARGHSPETIRDGVVYLIQNVFTDKEKATMYESLRRYASVFSVSKENISEYDGKTINDRLFNKYINACYFIGVDHPDFICPTIEEGKRKAFIIFKHKVNLFAERIGAVASVGFSDDSLHNYESIKNLVDNIDHERFPYIKEYTIKLTNKNKKDKHIVRFNENNSEDTPLDANIDDNMFIDTKSEYEDLSKEKKSVAAPEAMDRNRTKKSIKNTADKNDIKI